MRGFPFRRYVIPPTRPTQYSRFGRSRQNALPAADSLQLVQSETDDPPSSGAQELEGFTDLELREAIPSRKVICAARIRQNASII